MKLEHLNMARRNKKDEFYTMYDTIEKEIIYYKNNLKNKIVYLNCDNPKYSNFFKYFVVNFKRFELKCLFVTYLDENISYKYMIKETNNMKLEDFSLEKLLEIKDNDKIKLKGNGSYDSPECLDVLKESDVVITNPPFSKLRHFISTVTKYNKDLIILGNINTFVCKDISPLIARGRIRLGISITCGDVPFEIPNEYDVTTQYSYKNDNDKNIVRVTAVRWITTLKTKEHSNKKVNLTKEYDEEKYSKFLKLDILNVNVTNDIPKDYYGIMGVPITFLDKYNDEQFEILEDDIINNNAKEIEVYKLDENMNETKKVVVNSKSLIREFNPKKDRRAKFKDVNNGKLYVNSYKRILIKRKTT